MCGICGIYNLDGQPVRREMVEKMNRTMVHRGPDGEGIFLDCGVGLGHRRLSIIDLNTGDQPMGNEDGSIQVVFNGEIYNFLELKALLEAKGHRFRTKSDTESIIHGYEEWGEDFIRHLRGMFAIGLWDGRRKKLVLVRDRVGKKPLYYFKDKDRIMFASELKALLEDQNIPKDLDFTALDCYLSFGYVPSPLSIFKMIKKLPPGHFAVCEDGNFDVHPYWHLDMAHPIATFKEADILEELRSLFDEAVKLRLISDVPLGAFLSGGVDSSAVVASMALLKGEEAVKTASIGFSEERFNELEYARVVADQYHTDHTEFIVEPDALDVIERIVWHLDEPFADSSAIPTYYVSQMARQKVTVALSGDGGDETFAGYVQRYYMNRFEDNIRRKIPHPLRRHALGPISKIYPRVDFLPRPLRLKTFLGNLSRSFEEAYFRDMSFYFLPEMKKRLYRNELKEAVRGFDALDILGEHLRANHNGDVTTRVQYVDIKTYLPEDILVKVDRMSMAHSLEVRSPLLDHHIIEYAGRLPSAVKLKGMVSKYILKKMMEDRLPKDILYRGKQGFSIPLAAWLRSGLRDFGHEILFSVGSGIRDYFNENYVKALWAAHQKGRQNNATPLWGLMMLEMWRRRFL